MCYKECDFGKLVFLKRVWDSYMIIMQMSQEVNGAVIGHKVVCIFGYYRYSIDVLFRHSVYYW